jgi:hypothetical protein
MLTVFCYNVVVALRTSVVILVRIAAYSFETIMQ